MTEADRSSPGVTAPDPLFSDPRLAEIYDHLDDDRSDLDAYVDMVREFGASSVLDVGCGTGSLACRLAPDGIDVTAVDPAGASIAVARRKAPAGGVRWIHGDATALPALAVDLAVMTGNVAQVFLSDGDWHRTLTAVHAALRPSGLLIFETRDPNDEGWLRWTPDQTRRDLDVPGVGQVTTWIELCDVAMPYVSFRHRFHFAADGADIVSDSRLRFRSMEELSATLTEARFSVREVRDAHDRPGRELVVIAEAARRA